jgi:hypothetical protein
VIIFEPKFKKKKKPKPVQTDRVQFDFLGQKQVQTGLAWFFSGLVQFGFSVLGL